MEPSQQQANNQADAPSNDGTCPSAPEQQSEAAEQPLTSQYPHLEKALVLAAQQAAEDRNGSQQAALLNEFAAEELRTLSRILPGAQLMNAEDSNSHHAASSPQGVSDMALLSMAMGRTAAVPSVPEVLLYTQALYGWHGVQALAAGTTAHLLQQADMFPEASRKRTYEAMAVDPVKEEEDAKHGSSKFRGVYKRRFDTKWRAEITAGRRKRCLGSYASELEAAEAYDKAALTLRGPAAFTNFPAGHYASISTRNEPVNAKCGSPLKHRRFMGVTWCNNKHKFEARIWTKDGSEHKLLGLFDSAEDAANAYDREALKIHGQEAYTNFVLKPSVAACHGVPQKPSRQRPRHSQEPGLSVSVKPNAEGHMPAGKGSSKFRGVSWHKDNMKWRATIFKGSKPVHIGYFESQLEAARAYDQEAIRLRGPNTTLNYPITDYDVGPPEQHGSDTVPAPAQPKRVANASGSQHDQHQQQSAQTHHSDTLLPNLDSRLVAVFGQRNPSTSAAATSSDQAVRGGMQHKSAPDAAGPQQDVSQAAATSLQGLLQTNPGILKTIQPTAASDTRSRRRRSSIKSSPYEAEASLAVANFLAASQTKPAPQFVLYDSKLFRTNSKAQGSCMQGASISSCVETQAQPVSELQESSSDMEDQGHSTSRSASASSEDQSISPEDTPVRTRTRVIRKPQYRQ